MNRDEKSNATLGGKSSTDVQTNFESMIARYQTAPAAKGRRNATGGIDYTHHAKKSVDYKQAQ